MLVYCSDAVHAGEGALVLVDALVRAGALKGKLHRRCVEGLAVVELDATPQLEGVGLEVRRNLPALGQQRTYRAVAVDLGECLEKVVQRDFSDRRRGACGGIQSGRGLQRHRQHQCFPSGLRLTQRQGCQCAAGDGGCECVSTTDHGDFLSGERTGPGWFVAAQKGGVVLCIIRWPSGHFAGNGRRPGVRLRAAAARAG